MNKCSITDQSIKQIQSDIRRITMSAIMTAKKDKSKKLEIIKSGISTKLQEYINSYTLADASNRNTVIQTILDTIKDDIKNTDLYFFNAQNLNNIVVDFINKVETKETDYKLPVSSIEKNTSATDVKQIKDEFLLNAYGTAVEVRLDAVNFFDQQMVKAVIMNRENGSVTKNTTELNRNLEALQNQLLNNIYNYLRSLNTISGTLKALIGTEMFKDQKYTGIVEKLSEHLESLGNPETLMTHRARAKFGKQESKLALEAYNSYVLLKNFNQYLKLIFKDNILIKRPNKYEYDQYLFSEQGKNITNSWRKDENINVADEISGICKKLISTTERYSWKNRSKINGFVTFQEFEYIIAKIKDLGNSYAADTIILEDMWDRFSDDTKEAITGKTLAGLINDIRNNPQEVLPAVFEILSNKQFYDKYKGTGIFNKLKSFELNTIYSIYKGIFSKEEGSIRHTDPGLNNRFYYKICSIADNIFPTQFMQYYLDDDGELKIRNISDRHYDEASRNIEDIVQAYLHPELGNLNRLKKKYNTKIEIKSKDGIATHRSLIIPNTDIKIITNNRGEVKFLKGEKTYQVTSEDINNRDLQEFVEDILHQGIFNMYSRDLLNALIEEYNGSAQEVISDLLKECSRILFTAQVNQEFLQSHKEAALTNQESSQINKTDLESLINAQFPKSDHKINYNYGQIKLFSNNVTLLKRLAAAQLALNGLSTSVTVADGEGNMQNTVTLSRLLGMYQTQFSDIKTFNGAANDFLILDKNIFQGVVTSKEFYTSGKTKQQLDFTVAEFAYASFISDYIGGLAQTADEGLGKGIIGILPSENSDKKVIGKMRINVDATLPDGQTLRKMSIPNLTELIRQQLGGAYNKLEESILKDYLRLLSWSNIVNDIPEDIKNHPAIRKLTKWINGNLNDSIINIPDITNALNILWGNNAYNELNTRILQYNKIYPYQQLAFIDQLHYIKNKNGSLSFNIALEGILKRFSNIINTETFFREREEQVLMDLLNADFKVDLSENKTKEQRHLIKNYPDWINRSGYMILAKVRSGNRIYEIVNASDLDNIFEIDEIQLHPELSKYNRLDYLFSEEYLLATVGTHLTHPSKYSGSNPNEDEALRKKAQNKRNVSMTASLKQFILNSFKGVPSKYTIAVVEDIKDSQYNVMGNVEDGVKPYDGATFANPFIVVLENNSLDDAVGVDKKPFIHFYNVATASGGIIKTASFGLTNDRIRNSKQNQAMMKKMTDRPWLDKNFDATRSDTSEKVEYDIPIYYKVGDSYYREIRRTFSGNSTYNILRIECNEFGEEKDYSNIPTDGVIDGQFQYEGKRYLVKKGKVVGELVERVIDSNYKLWQSFGGMYSLEMKNDRLQPSENSIKLVVHTMIHANRVNSVGDVEQPLKESDIHYIVTEGAIKQGAANVNYHQRYIDSNGVERLSNRYTDDSELSTMVIDIKQAGIQLDKEHHADGSEISMFTQVISACAAKGYSLQRTKQLYKALRHYTDLATKDIREAIIEYYNNTKTVDSEELVNTDTIYAAVNKAVIKALSTSGVNETNFATLIAKDIIQDLRTGKRIDFSNPILPYSDSTLFNKIVSIITVQLTNSGIKSKMPGILCVLNPSFGIMKIYGDRKLESFSSQQELENLQNTYLPIFTVGNGTYTGNLSSIDIGRKYTVTINGESSIRNITTPREYYNLRKEIEQEIINGSEISITEYIMDGRDLASYNVRFSAAVDGNTFNFQLYDLKSIQDLYEFEETKVVPEGFTEKQYRQYLRNLLQEDLFKLSPDYKGQNNEIVVKTLGRTVTATIDRNSLQVQPYEVIMPKTFKTEFNLDTYDNVYDITKDKLFFVRKLLRAYSSKITNEDSFDVELKRLDGNHFYILDKEHITRLPNNMTLVNIDTTVDENGNVFRTDDYNNIIYQLSSASDQVYKDESGNEVIVTDNIQYYLDNLKYNSLRFTKSKKVKYEWLLGLIKDQKTPQLKYIQDYFKDVNSEVWFDRLNTDLNSVNTINPDTLTESDVPKNKPLALLYKQGIKIHTSFLKSLEVVAARIPAQSMQSFMPMKVIAYENANVNTAYVSTAQIWLQGSKKNKNLIVLKKFNIFTI